MQRSDLSEDLQDLASLARDVAESKISPLIAATEESATFSPEIKEILASAGFFGLVVPEDYGGVQSDIGHQCIVLEEIARVYPSACTYLTAHWLATKLIALHATGDSEAELPCTALLTPLTHPAAHDINATQDRLYRQRFLLPQRTPRPEHRSA